MTTDLLDVEEAAAFLHVKVGHSARLDTEIEGELRQARPADFPA